MWAASPDFIVYEFLSQLNPMSFLPALCPRPEMTPRAGLTLVKTPSLSRVKIATGEWLIMALLNSLRRRNSSSPFCFFGLAAGAAFGRVGRRLLFDGPFWRVPTGLFRPYRPYPSRTPFAGEPA